MIATDPTMRNFAVAESIALCVNNASAVRHYSEHVEYVAPSDLRLEIMIISG